jgi:hypothetical protein
MGTVLRHRVRNCTIGLMGSELSKQKLEISTGRRS